LSLSVMILSGCKKYLDTYNPSDVTTGYYDTRLGQEKLVVDLYSRYRQVFNTSTLQFFGTDMYMATDESPTSAMFNGYSKELSGLSPEIDNYWSVLYKIIQESNILLNRCTPEIAGDSYTSLVSQGRFLRAMAYYYLVETFGDVPLLLKENTRTSDLITNVTRESEDSIYDFMIGELNDIKGTLPKVAPEAGRLSNAAVLQLLGKLYLTRSYRGYAKPGDADSAIECFESIISSGPYHLLDNFADVFNEDNQNNAEIIWSIQYGTDKNYIGSGNPQQAEFGFNIVALYPGLFTLNQQDYSAMQRGIWINPIVQTWFRHPEIDSRYDATFKRKFLINDVNNPDYGKLGIYFPRWNDTTGDSENAKYFFPFKNARGNHNWVPALPLMNWTTDAMPIVQKFKDTKIAWGGAGSREDVIFRLAGTYFLCAEAYLKAGEPDKALEKVNIILRRAAGNDTNYDIMKIASPSDLKLDRLLEEKGCEMLGEHDRWFDLKRTKTLLTRAQLNPLVEKYNNLSATDLIRPIPYDETIKLKGLKQNPGYNN
jgi:tetratricopeptide (TPR) repeat protein